MGSSLYTPRVTGNMNCALWDFVDVGATTEENQVPSPLKCFHIIFSEGSLGYHLQHLLGSSKSLTQPSVDREAGCLSLGAIFPSPPSEDGNTLQVRMAWWCPV